MNRIMILALIYSACCSGAMDLSPEAEEVPHANLAVEEEGLPLRHIEVTLFGSISRLEGIDWPDDPHNRWRSWSLTEPCDLTVHLPAGRTLRMRTRPILIVSRIMPTDVVGAVDAPPEGKRASLREKAEEAERLLAQWGIEPDERMREGLEEWRKRDYLGAGSGGLLRVGMYVDEVTYLAFRVQSGGPSRGGWHLVVEIEAKAQEMQRIRRQFQGQ
jgi:hypothetical protein